MPPVFLIGGGRDPELSRAAHEPFARACGDGPVAVVMLDEGEGADEQRWLGTLADAGLRELTPVVIAENRPHAGPEPFEDAAGVFVCGGLTPLYRALLVERGREWLPPGAVYGGYSAGAAIASEHALVGGWRVERGGRELPVCPEEASEDLERVTVLPGLGLVPFAVDVHAAQWGTLPRLAHAVAAGMAPSGLAIDEHACVEVAPGGELTLHGEGGAYAVAKRRGGGLTLELLG